MRIPFEALAVLIKVDTGCLCGAGEERTHHDARRAEGEGLGDVTDVADATVGDDGDAKVVCVLGNSVDRRALGTSDSHDLLGDANRARAHADTEGIGTRGDERGGLLLGDDVAGNDLQVTVGGLDVLDHVHLPDRIALRRVNDDDVDAGLHEKLEARAVVLAGRDGGATKLYKNDFIFNFRRESFLFLPATCSCPWTPGGTRGSSSSRSAR